jgi:alpha-glucosidase
VWPGVTAFPDWFHPNTQHYWNDEFGSFFSADDGVDIDGLWIDMNEATNFCPYPCNDPFGFAKANDLPPAPPPVRAPPRSLPGFPSVLQPPKKRSLQTRHTGDKLGLPNRNLTYPPYDIANAQGPTISEQTLNTDLIHANGVAEYDVHNLYGTSKHSYLYVINSA